MESDIFDKNYFNILGNLVDLDYSWWLYKTILLPLLITFLLPFVFVFLIYFSSLSLFIFKLHSRVLWREIRSDDIKFWQVAIRFVAAVWDCHARIYHGYEIKGIEHLPKDGPAMIVYYHGAIPIDMYYFVARVFLEYDRLIYTIADRFLFRLPGWGIISEAMKVSPGTIKTCVKILNDGNLMAISPGGVYEAQFGNNYYELMWQNRMGFAKVAIESKAPIIPMFTENIREGFRSISIAKRIFVKLYNLSRFPVRPIFGGFPVKFRTHLGPPILYEAGTTPEQLVQKVANAIEELIVKNQRIPGSILHALIDRFRDQKTQNVGLNKKKQRKYSYKENKNIPT